jgi:hypothetical protein
MDIRRFDLPNGFVVFSVCTLLFGGIDIHFAGRLFQFLCYMLGWAVFSALVVYPVKTRRAAKKQKVVDDQKRAAEAAAKPSFAATRKGIRKS